MVESHSIRPFVSAHEADLYLRQLHTQVDILDSELFTDEFGIPSIHAGIQWAINGKYLRSRLEYIQQPRSKKYVQHESKVEFWPHMTNDVDQYDERCPARQTHRQIPMYQSMLVLFSAEES